MQKIAAKNLTGHLHINDLNKYHLTVGTFEAANTNNPLRSKSDALVVWNTIGKNLTNNIKTYNQNGHAYGIYLFAHGFDGNNNSVNYHYSNPTTAKANLKKHFSIDKGIRLTHFHIVARHDTSFLGGPKGQFAVDCESGISKLTQGSNAKFQDANLQSSKGNYCGHITLAVMKRKAGVVTINSDRFGTKFFDSILNMYEVTANDFAKNTANSNGQVKIELNKFHTSAK